MVFWASREAIELTGSLETEEARGWSNLLAAAEKGDVEAIQSELAAGADINVLRRGR
jgi:uncharacterized protein